MRIEAIKIDGVEYVIKKSKIARRSPCNICEFGNKSPHGLCDLCDKYIPFGEYPVRKENNK